MFVGEVVGFEVLHRAIAVACHFDIGKGERKESRRISSKLPMEIQM
jgi:hypothetical protein